MTNLLNKRLSQLSQSADLSCLKNLSHGIEKESLRVDPNGHIAMTPHPYGLGSALTNPYITTDFSEALVEFITPVFQDPNASMEFLEGLHTFLYQQLDNEELLWTSSMPCIIQDDDSIPLALYGNSNVGKTKTLYRKGLGFRYGRSMQTIAGIHFNFSLPDEFWIQYQQVLGSDLGLKDFKTEQYFALIRNFRRWSWLLIYLFGASPAICKSFVRNNPNHGLDKYDDNSLFLPFGTSLRMSDLGYTSNAQSGLDISYNSLEEYTRGLADAIRQPYEPYKKYNSNDAEHPNQINDSILQIENEFYSTIRPKREAPSGKRPIHILNEEGVEYVEVRCLDLNPFMSVGIDQQQIGFLNAFLMACLLHPSPDIEPEEEQEIRSNLVNTVKQGRDPDLMLQDQGTDILLRDWATKIITLCQPAAEMLDTHSLFHQHQDGVTLQADKVKDAALTPSASVIRRMDELGTPYFRFAMNQSLANSDYFRMQELDASQLHHLHEAAELSHKKQAEIEQNDTLSLPDFLQQTNMV